MKELLKLQKRALDLGARFLCPGGILVYSTCTLNKEENEKQVEKFLNRNSEFTLELAEQFIPKEFTENGYLKTIPFKHNSDGAFAASMKKKI
jgi:16S rRNA (cytosine967-C5)-methyltransferase